jgi:hypothetical protein
MILFLDRIFSFVLLEGKGVEVGSQQNGGEVVDRRRSRLSKRIHVIHAIFNGRSHMGRPHISVREIA